MDMSNGLCMALVGYSVLYINHVLGNNGDTVTLFNC
jgi:hypothetical protein